MESYPIVKHASVAVVALCTPAVWCGAAHAADPAPGTRGAPTAPAHAAPPQAPTAKAGASNAKKEAAAAYEKATSSFATDDFAAAAKYAELAYSLHPLPHYALYLARSLAETGKILEAIRVYEELAALDVPNGSPPLLRASVELARKELPEARKRTVKVQVVETPSSTNGAAVTIDGVAGAAGETRETNPGQHRIEIAWGLQDAAQGSPAARPATASVNVWLAEGGTNVFSVSAPSAPAMTTTNMNVPPCEPPQCDRTGRSDPEARSVVLPASPRPSYTLPVAISLGLGVAGLSIGTAAGLSALSLAEDLKEQCVGTTCPASSKPTHDAASDMATFSNAGFIVGAGGLLAGGLLLVLPHVLPAKQAAGFVITPTFAGVAAKGEF